MEKQFEDNSFDITSTELGHLKKIFEEFQRCAASLKVCKPDLELLTDRNLLGMTERMIRGGIASVYSSRLETANSPLLPNFDVSKEVTSIVYIDANNLYGGIMLKYAHPLRAFELITEIILEDLINADDEGDIGCVVEVDLEYPDELHEKYSDFSLISDKHPIDPLELRDHQTKMKNALKITKAKTEKPSTLKSTTLLITEI